ILVNNGGMSQRSLCMDTSLDVYRKLIELNYLGTVSLTKCVLPHMIERKQGKIVTVNSILGIISAPLSIGYCASKHALRGFFNGLRTELATYPGIIVSNIFPGPVQSNIVENSLAGEVTKTIGNNGDQSHKMTTSRCVRLMLISMANDLKEVWISEQPFLMQTLLILKSLRQNMTEKSTCTFQATGGRNGKHENSNLLMLLNNQRLICDFTF
ncbi:DHRS7 isoform 5, partial [Pongo abelii]